MLHNVVNISTLIICTGIFLQRICGIGSIVLDFSNTDVLANQADTTVKNSDTLVQH